MGSVYVYESDCEDFATIGICGALTPISCTFHEIANGLSSIELEHPIDALGRHACLRELRILKCDVPVRSVPEIANGQYVTSVTRYTVRNTATKDNRYIYKGKNPSSKKQKKLKLVPAGAEVFVVATYLNESYRWKVKYTYAYKQGRKVKNRTITGYMDHSDTTLHREDEIDIQPSSTGIESVAPSWTVEEQLFRIVSIEKTEKTIHVTADHISYDLMHNMTGCNEVGEMTLQEAGEAVLDGCFEPHDFEFQTNLTGTRAGHHYRNMDPITALLDEEEGLVSRWHGELIRDNYTLTVLDHAGVDRGAMLTYGKNITGITVTLDLSEVVTAVRPVGATENDAQLYLTADYLYNGTQTVKLATTNGIVYGRWHRLTPAGELTCRLPFARFASIEGEDCKVDKKNGLSTTLVRRRLLAQAVEQLDSGVESPEITVKVDMQLLGYTEQYALYRDLETLFLFDTVRVRHPSMGIDIKTRVTEIEWDCLEDMPVSLVTDNLDSYMTDQEG